MSHEGVTYIAAPTSPPSADARHISLGLTAWDYAFRGLALASVLLFVALAWDLLSHPNMPRFSTPESPAWFYAVYGFGILPLWWLVGTLIVWRVPGNLVGRFLILIMIGALGWQFTFGIGDWLGMRAAEFSSVAFVLFVFYWGSIGFPSLVFLLMVFPDGRWFPPRWRPWVLLFAVAKVLGTILEIVSYGPGTASLGPTVSFNPFFVPILAPYETLITRTIGSTGLIIVPGILMGIASLTLRYRSSSTRVQQQIKWLIWWSVVFVLMVPLYYVASLGIPIGNEQISAIVRVLTYFNLGGMLIAAIGVALLRYHLLDIDLILNRTLVYGGMTATVVIGYVLMVGLLSAQFRSGDNMPISLLTTGIIAILFQPVRERLHRAVNRLIYGERDEPYRLLSQLGQRLETTLAPNALLPTICESIAKALKVPYAAIELAVSEGTMETSASYPPSKTIGPTSSVVRFPLANQHETLGELIVAPRVGEDKFSAADVRLLTDLARQVGIAARAAQLTVELQHARARLVTAREEERRRIRRDLHDGLGPALAAQQLKVGAARALLTSNPAGTETLLSQLEGDIETAMMDIRRLVYELRPPALDELGLLGALRSQVAQYDSSALSIHFEATESLPTLSAAVEVAAYRIAREALTNVVHHARAKRCWVRVEIAAAGQGRSPAAQLLLEISDDGVGLTRDVRAGVGMMSMRERAVELGGTCIIENRDEGGTRVLAQLPIALQTGSDD